MATSELSAWDGQLKIILLGGRNCGKSSVGNLLLGKEEFVPQERTSCSRRLAVVAGRCRLTVVDTPGWWCDLSSRDTSELVKREVVSSVSLCAPGPHAFLIAIKASSAFTEKRRRAVEEHVALLGEAVWRHCMVVFVSAAGSEECAAAAELVRRGGGALRWLSGKCGGRCHCVTSASELLDEIRELVSGNGNGSAVFEVQESVARATAEEKRSVEERARQRFVRMKKHRSLMRETLRPVTDIRIVLLGATGSGKSSSLNTILGGQSVQQRARRTARCLVGRGAAFGRRVTVVDTPGWWMNYFRDETPAFDRRELALAASLCPPGPHVFLLAIRADRAFTETYRRAAEEHLGLIGERVWGRVIVLLTFGDWLGGATAEQCIESGGEPLRWLVERCGNRYHVLNNKTRGDDGFQVRELIGKIEEMLAGRGGCPHHEVRTDAVERLRGEMRREEERAEERLRRKETQRQTARAQLEKLTPLTELRIVLVGGSKTGKSSCGNTILSRECFHAETPTTSCSEKRATIRGKTVTVLDTPGRFSVTSDLLRPASCAILLVVNASSSFDAERAEAAEKQMEAGGGGRGRDQMWSRAAVLFSHGDWLGGDGGGIERRIESEAEPLRRLVERCGNRYHVLDNKQRGRGAQVDELLGLVEETLAADRLAAHRLAALRRGGGLTRDGDSLRDVAPGGKGQKTIRSRRHRLCHDDLTESTNPATQPSPSCSGGPDAAGQIVALPARRAGWTGLGVLERESLLSSLASARWTVNLPVWLPADGVPPRLNGARRLFPSTHPSVLLVVPQTHRGMLADEHDFGVHSLCRPALRERTLRRLGEAGGLQALIDQWGDSSLEELEAFIDSYFEMIWEKTMGSFQEPAAPTAERDADGEEEEEEEARLQEVLSSIDRKLSKLELLEEIRADLAELRTSVENSWRAIQELRSKQNRIE